MAEDIEQEYQNDTASLEDVFQQPDQGFTVPVRVENAAVTVNHNPTQLGRCLNVVMSSSSSAVLVLNREPRRARAVMWMYPCGGGADAVVIGPTQAQAEQFTGAALISSNAITRYEFTNTSELWARPCNIDTSGSFTASTSACVLSVVEELWTR